MKLAKTLYCAAAVAMIAASNSVFAQICFPTQPGCTTVTVPEPGSMALIGIALAGAVAVARRSRK